MASCADAKRMLRPCLGHPEPKVSLLKRSSDRPHRVLSHASSDSRHRIARKFRPPPRLIRHSRASPVTRLRSISRRFPLAPLIRSFPRDCYHPRRQRQSGSDPSISRAPTARLYLNCPPAVFDLYPRGFTGHVAHPSRSIRCGEDQRPGAGKGQI